MRRTIALLVILLFSLGLAIAQGTAPRVSVNGALLNAPIKEVRGSLLLPMRAVFEALQAEVRWFPAARQITATRGSVTVQLWIDRNVAIVNDQEITLKVPPTLIDGTTYVPLRFPAEAFGGDVAWMGAQRLAVVTIAPLAPEITVENTVPPALAKEITGVLITHAATRDGESLVIREPQAGELLTETIPAGTALTRNREAAAFADLQPGDLMVITRDAAGKVLGVSASYQLIDGKVAGFAESKLMLQDGAVYQVSPQAQAQDARGNAVALADLRNGQQVTLRVTPGTTMIWGITVPPVMPAPDPVQIVSVGALDYSRPLRKGDTLTLLVTGPPGADKVTARLGETITGIELVEREPGKYLRQITLGADLPVTEAPLIALFRKGTDTREVQSAGKILIDQTAPVCRLLDPSPDTPIFDTNPVIMAAIDDDGAGIDLRTVRLLVNGKDVTANAEVAEHSVRYSAKGLPYGTSRFRLEMADRAGNATAQDWQLEIRRPQPEQEPEIYAVYHDAMRPLRRGDMLTIRVTATPRADRVTAGVGTAITNIDLTEREPGRYFGTVTIDRDIRVSNVPVYATLRDGNAVRQAESVQRLSVDTRPPQFAVLTQEPAETYARDYPIGLSFSDEDSGVDLRAVRLLLNGRDVTNLATISDREIRYNAVDLPYGTSTFRLEVYDRAGNVSTREWQVVVREKPPLVFSVTHDANTMLKHGDTLTIRVIATADADEVWVRVGNTITNIRLTEEKPGRYMRQITIKDDIHADDVYIYAVAHRNGLDSEEIRSERRVTIDSEDPRCTSFSPRRGATLEDLTPTIEASYQDDGTGVVPGKVKLLVNGQDVTAQATVTERHIKYAPQNLAFGTVSVVLTLEDKVGNSSRTEWSFTLKEPPAISEVTHSASKTLDPGDTVKITAKLNITPARLEWLLDDTVISQEMNGGNGTYSVSYTIKPADPAGKHRVGLRCTKGNGQAKTMYAGSGLTIAEIKSKDLTITSPDNGSRAGSSVTVAGVAAASAQVRVTITSIATVAHIREESAQVAQVTAKTNADGLWSTGSINLPDKPKRLSFTITAELLDANGNVTKTATVKISR
ncbi:MAG: copper amine oxidase N-terminal domain-containing protein [Armatimonadota bacterium]